MKFKGIVGFWVEDVEVKPDVYKSKIVERPYICEALRQTRRFQSSNNQNEDLNVTNRISILSDLYALEHWFSIKYIVWNGVAWKVESVDLEYPRLTLTVGGVYKNERPGRTGGET